MRSTRLRGLLAAGTVASLASLAFAPALVPGDPLTRLVTADDLGLSYAPRVVHVDAPTLADRNAVVALGVDVTEHASNDHVEVLLHTAADEARLRDAGYDFEVEVADLVLDASERLAADAAYTRRVDGVSPLTSGRTTYRMLDDFAADIDQLVAMDPTVAKRISIGQSVEGRDLVGIEIGARVDEEDGRPVFLMFGVHHAREWPSAELPMEFAFDLVTGFTAGDTRVTDLLERAKVVIVPVSNPDGYDVSRTQGETLDFSNGPAWWRKNCRVVDGQSQPMGTCQALPLAAGQTGPIGVDLNRNYGGLWGGPGADAGFTAPDYSFGLGNLSGTYRGPSEFSEPETQAIRDLISTRQVTTLITNHTRGHLLLRPNGVAPDTVTPFDGKPRGYAPDECFTLPDGSDYGMQALGERMTAQNGYSNQFGWELYDTTGTTEDYSYNATGGYGYTFELMPGGGSFHPPYEVVVDEYLGTNLDATSLAALEGTPQGQFEAQQLTTSGKDDCAGDPVRHTTLGGGLRESYFIALENAADARTHALVVGTAPVGAEITVTRTGEFPRWDASTFTDTVTSSMTVGPTGAFEFHVNPSTRPILDSRRYTDPDTGEVVATGRRDLDGELFAGEFWTVSCDGGPGVDVLVDRGGSVDVGDICA